MNGYPDDHNGATYSNREHWAGGETTVQSIGISYGIANVASVSAGLSFAQDTYKGKGVGGSFGYSVDVSRLGKNKNGNVGINSTMGISPYGDMYSSLGIGAGIGGASTQISLTSTSGLNIGAGISVGSMLDASISMNKNGISSSASTGGYTSDIDNARSGNISTYSDNVQLEIPVYPGVNVRLARDYVRYWIDETVNVHTFGALYTPGVVPNYVSAFDTYDILDTDIDFANFSNEEEVLGGSFPDYDSYTVTAQGISGNIRPYSFKQHLHRQDKQDASTNVITRSYPLSTSDPSTPLEYRFVGDFSNRFEYEAGDFQVTPDDVSYNLFYGNTETGETGNDGYFDHHLAGSKHVEWYSNAEILLTEPGENPFEEGFINCSSQGFVRDDNTQVGGYSITNSTGVTYHYALPVYSYEEFTKSENSSTKQDEDGLKFNTLNKPEKYAYTWLLTAVTGPDFVDRNNNGLADHDDWGYWVNFDYKLWLDDYKWRNPGEGKNRDVDGEFEFLAYGKKEIYYLERITTQTHVALFEKSERIDGREVANLLEGGFDPIPILQKSEDEIECRDSCEESFCFQGNCDEEALENCENNCDVQYEDVLVGYEFASRSTQRLDKIKLYNYYDFTANRITDDFVIRAIDFTFDYSLATGTPNSYDEADFTNKQGKLSLKNIQFAGKGNVSLIPPMHFMYKNTAPYEKDKIDIWGFYKSDYSEDFRNETNDIIGRLTTDVSSEDVDMWSLNQVHSSLGSIININYGSDSYTSVALSRQQLFNIKDVINLSQNRLKLTFWEDVQLSNFFHEEEAVELNLIGSYENSEATIDMIGCDHYFPLPYEAIPMLFHGRPIIKEVSLSGKYIVVEDANLYNDINAPKEFNKERPNSYYDNNSCFNCYCDHQEIVKYKYSFTGSKSWPGYFPAGTISLNEDFKFGGGVRVDFISIESNSGEKRMTQYDYDQGTTSYEPFQILPPRIHPDYGYEPIRTRILFKQLMLGKMYREIGMARNIPGPGVVYGMVTVREKTVGSDGTVFAIPNYSRFEFETYKPGMVSIDRTPTQIVDNMDGDHGTLRFGHALLNKVVLKDYSARVGALKRVALFDEQTNSLISETVNHYLHDGLDDSFEQNKTVYEERLEDRFNNQGLIEETFTRARVQYFGVDTHIPYIPNGEYATIKEPKRYLLATLSKLETFPSVQVGQKNTNFKTGVVSSTEDLAFDFYSGEVVKTLTTDSHGKKYLTESIPAYKHYGAMGLKIHDNANRHMLTQTTGQYSFLADDDNTPIGLLSASVQTWSNLVTVLNGDVSQEKIWRKMAAYQWNGDLPLNSDGSYPIEDFASNQFNWNGLANSKWEKSGETTKYDVFSHALEAQDINGNFAATRMNGVYTKVIASAANSRYDEMAYSGAEYIGTGATEGGATKGQGVISDANVHTGKYSLLVEPAKQGFQFQLSTSNVDLTKKYRASVWVYAPGNAETQTELNKIQLYSIVNGVTQEVHPTLQKSKSKSWYLLNLDIDPKGYDVIIGCKNNAIRGVYFDDFRVHPIDASMTSYVYDSFSGELNFILDNNNLYTKFEYDAMGRLVRTSKEQLNYDFGEGKESYKPDQVLSDVRYNYKNQ